MRYKRCANCGKGFKPEKPYQNNCSIECSIARNVAVVEGMRTKSGPFWEKWKRSMKRAVGVIE